MNETRPRWLQSLEVLNILLALGLLIRWWMPSSSMYTCLRMETPLTAFHRPNAVQQQSINSVLQSL